MRWPQDRLHGDRPVNADVISAMVCRLEETYSSIHRERMADLPLVNPEIGVYAVGFRESEHGLIGVLITPWCMNLVSLPLSGNDWSDKPELSEETLTFPSGSYTFTVGCELEIGKYRSCSLFSPMFQFADDQAAIETAEVIMRELLNEDHHEAPDMDTRQIQSIWNGEPEQKPAQKEKPAPALAAKLERQVSRRELLLGMFRDEENRP